MYFLKLNSSSSLPIRHLPYLLCIQNSGIYSLECERWDLDAPLNEGHATLIRVFDIYLSRRESLNTYLFILHMPDCRESRWDWGHQWKVFSIIDTNRCLCDQIGSFNFTLEQLLTYLQRKLPARAIRDMYKWCRLSSRDIGSRTVERRNTEVVMDMQLRTSIKNLW